MRSATVGVPPHLERPYTLIEANHLQVLKRLGSVFPQLSLALALSVLLELLVAYNRRTSVGTSKRAGVCWPLMGSSLLQPLRLCRILLFFLFEIPSVSQMIGEVETLTT